MLGLWPAVERFITGVLGLRDDKQAVMCHGNVRVDASTQRFSADISRSSLLSLSPARGFNGVADHCVLVD